MYASVSKLVNWIKKCSLSEAAFFILAFLVFAGDQLSKFWVVQKFKPGETWPLIPDIFHLTYVRNPGAAFGIFADQTSFFIVISLIMVAIIILARRFLSGSFFLLRFALAILLGGALGNLSDRLRMGYVIDFLDLRFWPVFNLADIALVLGIGLVILSLLRQNLLFFGRKN